MKNRLQSILALMLTVALLFSGLCLPQTAWAADDKTPEELEITWRIKANADHAWSSESARENGKVYARYNLNDSFMLDLAGTTVLSRTGISWGGNPYFQPITENEYSRSCAGGGTYTTWYLSELQRWTEKGSEKKDFESTTVENWQYRWPGKEHEGADDNPIPWLEIIPPESDNEPIRYRICLEPFFFIDYDTADEYFETTGTIHSNWTDWEGSHSETGELGNHAGGITPSLANQAWYDRVETNLDGSCAKGELTYSGGKYRGQGTVQHTFYDEDGKSSIEITYEINRKPSAKAIQPIQVLGRYEYNNDNDYVPATDFVAGKDTVIQVILPDDIKAEDQSNARVEIYHEGNKIATLSKFKKDKENNSLIFIPSSRSSCGNWKAGRYKFVATIGESEELTLDDVLFQEQRKLKVLAVPVKANYAGTIETADSQWKNGGAFMRRVYPIAYNNITYKQGSLFDASDASYDITTDAGRLKLWQALNELQKNGGPYDLIVGFIEKGILLSNGSILQGYTYGEPSNIVVNSDQDMQATVAHEIAHIYKVGDEYQGESYNLGINSPPLGYQGSDWHDPNKTVTASDPKVQPFPGAEGALISKKLHPYDTGGRGLLEDSICFMGSGASQSKNWITPSVWKHLFKALAAPTTAASDSSIRVLQSTEGETRVIEASGWVSRSGVVELSQPWHSYYTTQPLVNQTGTYTIQAVDTQGTVLASNGFTPSFFVRSNPPRQLERAPFAQVLVPFPAGTDKFVVLDQDNTLLAELPVTANKPTVAITAPAAGQNLTGTSTITWTAEDDDKDNLSYEVEYSPDGSNWELLAYDIRDTQWVQDFSQLPGGNQAQIRVTAHDGINSTAAVSGIFSVALKAPEVFIEAPVSEASYSTAEGGVVLQGSAYDPQEGQIYDDNRLVWTSDQAGELGRGPSVFTNLLSEGKHLITLTATNIAGLSSQVSISLNITSSAVVNPGTYTELIEKTFTDASQRKVLFNKPVNAATLQNNIRIMDSANNMVPIRIEAGDDGVSALIYPSTGAFSPGNYTIYIEQGIMSADGQPLNAGYKMNFKMK
ncbi:Ig-like domain-containing protein [Syntrophomonas wolfei]|uniref:MSP domain-containing protein n=1 Tax=Syntrophomonas wolfei subsp. wolfei (strain DSM 2245B / Goettingen) TaxID=335541 RepID=Q0B0I9_SYNWW|nr:Ig-like domain-containing protein [Syntrophomonas wolfei]ABI67515.1 hypothetical protein Swol_0163 [Syntrophomonas wolfei subsp. wolfei str. Goettingen G311]